MKNFRTLHLALELYKKCQMLRTSNKFHLKAPMKDQFERALLSIPLNLAEGNAKPSAKERRKYYFTALGSLREIQTILILANDQLISKDADILGAHLYLLCQRT